LILARPKLRAQFNAGDMVRVKSRDDILKSLDSTNKLDGCLFMDQMWNYCGSTYKISRVVNSYFNEQLKRTFSPKAPLYILENLYCAGKIDHFPHQCDHGCLIFWHERWLEKIP
jgi:hypothetical protein